MLYGNRIFCEFYFFLESFNLFGKIRKKGPITATTSSSYSSGNKNKTINLLSLPPLIIFLSHSFFLSLSFSFFLSFSFSLFLFLSIYLSLFLSLSSSRSFTFSKELPALYFSQQHLFPVQAIIWFADQFKDKFSLHEMYYTAL